MFKNLCKKFSATAVSAECQASRGQGHEQGLSSSSPELTSSTQSADPAPAKLGAAASSRRPREGTWQGSALGGSGKGSTFLLLLQGGAADAMGILGISLSLKRWI